MELLDMAVLNAVATTLVVCIGISVLATLAIWISKGARQHLSSTFLAILAFSLLGFVTGYMMGDSRESAVSAVLPAVLTLLGGATLFLFGSKGVQTQTVVSGSVIVFSLALFLGTHLGARLRFDFETAVADPMRLRQRELDLEQNRHALAVLRLLNYVQLLKLRNDFANQEKLDLSKFDSGLERKDNSGK
jgi:hypothetical protein